MLTLEPGDVIVMGTPAGVGQARTPPVWMKAGDTIEVEIERIGTLVQSRSSARRPERAKVYDVAIVGYGPAGAVAAALLGQQGLGVYVCERLPDVYEMPRAIALDHEIMRVFQQLGVVDAVAPFCEPFTPSEYFGVDGQLIRRMTMVAPPYPQGYTPSMVFTQPPVERALRARVAALPNVTVELGVELTRIVQDDERRRAGHRRRRRGRSNVPREVRDRLRRRARARCARSSTCRSTTSTSTSPGWSSTCWSTNRGCAKLPDVSVQYCEPERPCTLVIGPKQSPALGDLAQARGGPEQVASAEETWKLLSRWLTPEDGELWRQASYRFHALVAREWRRGRVFLAGDAAHMQPPFLGPGHVPGNTRRRQPVLEAGRRAARRGAGPAAEALLDSYGAERKAHVRELTSRIKGVGAVICERDPAKAQGARREVARRCRRDREGHAAAGHPAPTQDRALGEPGPRCAREPLSSAVAAASRRAQANGRVIGQRLAPGAGGRRAEAHPGRWRRARRGCRS